jgi:hypothetical protein
VTSIESLNIVKEKIDQFKFELQQKIKEYNKVSYERKEKQTECEEVKK